MKILEYSQALLKFVLLLSTNLVINTIGFIPSAFLKAINLSLYGTFLGTSLPLIGELIGTQVGFHL